MSFFVPTLLRNVQQSFSDSCGGIVGHGVYCFWWHRVPCPTTVSTSLVLVSNPGTLRGVASAGDAAGGVVAAADQHVGGWRLTERPGRAPSVLRGRLNKSLPLTQPHSPLKSLNSNCEIAKNRIAKILNSNHSLLKQPPLAASSPLCCVATSDSGHLCRSDGVYLMQLRI